MNCQSSIANCQLPAARRCFFVGYADFRDKLRARSGFAGSSNARSGRNHGTRNLIRSDSAFQAAWKLVRHIEDAQGKFIRAGFQSFRIHR